MRGRARLHAPLPIFGRRLRRERSFTLGGGYAGGVRAAPAARSLCAPALFITRALRLPRSGNAARRVRASCGFRPAPSSGAATTPGLGSDSRASRSIDAASLWLTVDPNASVRCDGGSIGQVWRCGIDFRWGVGRVRIFGIDVGDSQPNLNSRSRRLTSRVKATARRSPPTFAAICFAAAGNVGAVFFPVKKS